jgi:hypothetical protein
MMAAPGSESVFVSSPEPAWEVELDGYTPAFKPDGTLTHVRDGTVLTRTELARGLFGQATLEGVVALGWLSDSRVLALLDTAGAGQFAAVYTNGRPRQAANWAAGTAGSLQVSPDGAHVAVQAGTQVEIYDGHPGRVWASAFDEVLAFDWSPDGRWLAVAARKQVHLVRTSDWTAPVVLPLETEGIAWR